MKSGFKKGWNSIMPLRLRGKAATHFCVFPKVRSASFGPGNAPVYLNVYDLTPMNGYFYWAGIGIFHSGVEGLSLTSKQNAWAGPDHWKYRKAKVDAPVSENGSPITTKRSNNRKQAEVDVDFTKSFDKEMLDIFAPPKSPKLLLLPPNRVPCNTTLPEDCHYQSEDLVKLFLLPNVMCFAKRGNIYGVEYAFGAHDYPASGVFEVEPRQCPGFKFRKSIFMGTTCLDPNQVREFMEHHSANYNGDTYHLIVKNCNHFCKDICYKLTGSKIPKWVNRLARIGSVCNCILPEALKVSAVRHDPSYEGYASEKRRLRTAFSCLSSISMRQKQLSSSSLFIPSPFKGCLPSWELKRSNNLLKER